jgi:2-oxoglutarate ferredoxin oxidoreductase subunit beta
MNVIDTARPPERAASRTATFKPSLLLSEHHHLCPGCGEPVAIRLILEVIQELELTQNNICILGHGCYGSFIMQMDVDSTLCLHGRGPAVATGMKRIRPQTAIWTLQGDGDMTSEGLAEIMHAAARGENVTCFMLNNGVFGDTGGQMTASSVIGQRTKNTLEGRDAAYHGNPIKLAEIVAGMDGAAYVARGSVHNAASINATRKLIRKAFQRPMEGKGLALMEILTMCPTGWFVPPGEGAEYMMESLGKVYGLGELKDVAAAAAPEDAGV